MEVVEGPKEKTSEFCIEWQIGDNYAYVTAPSGTKLKSKLLQIGQVNKEFRCIVTNKDGSVVYKIPVKCIKIEE